MILDVTTDDQRDARSSLLPLRARRGKLDLEVKTGRCLWKEEYVGGQPYRGDEEEHWAPRRFGWKVLRGDGRVMSPEWFRVLIGKGYIHFRFRPFIFKVAYYNRRIDLNLRWN